MPHCVLATAVNRAKSVIQPLVHDGDLVARFTASGDPDAFAHLVRKHGPMVFRVCHRITRHRQDAEDAFQATFLVLARKAGTVNPASAVAGWLFGVAANAAREARKRSARRAARETLVAATPETGRCEPEPDFDRRAAVAEELAGLPESYRALVVACDLQGEPQTTAARRLGVPVGTVYSRLSTARRLLADRLRRRGISASAAVATLTALAPDTTALPPTSDCLSPGVTELAEAIMKRGFALRWKLAACVLLAGVAMGLADDAPKPAPAVAPAPRVADESRLVLGFAGHVRFLKPDGTEVSRLTGAEAIKAGADLPTRPRSFNDFRSAAPARPAAETFGPCGRAAPDGRLPIGTRKGLYLLTPGNPPVVAPAKAAKGDQALFASGDVPTIVAWSWDGKRAIGHRTKQALFSAPEDEHVLIDLAAGTTTELKLPKPHKIVDWSADGWFLTIGVERHGFSKGWAMKKQTVCKMSADGQTSDVLASYSFDGDWSRSAEFLSTGANSGSDVVALSPDGKRVACLVTSVVPIQVGAKSVPQWGIKLCVLELANNARAAVVFEQPGRRVDGTNISDGPSGVRWSPDGSRIGFLCDHREFGTLRVMSWRIGVVGADGRGAKTVFDSVNAAELVTVFDWR